MDTRQKIVGIDEAARIAANGAVVVSGYFDPLISSHAARLAELKRNGTPLLVLVATPVDAILPPAARAELIAGLRIVDYVSISANGLIPQIQLEQEDESWKAALIEHVHARQKAAC